MHFYLLQGASTAGTAIRVQEGACPWAGPSGHAMPAPQTAPPGRGSPPPPGPHCVHTLLSTFPRWLKGRSAAARWSAPSCIYLPAPPVHSHSELRDPAPRPQDCEGFCSLWLQLSPSSESPTPHRPPRTRFSFSATQIIRLTWIVFKKATGSPSTAWGGAPSQTFLKSFPGHVTCRCSQGHELWAQRVLPPPPPRCLPLPRPIRTLAPSL